MAGKSPTQLSLELMRARGYTCAITEHWNSFARIRQDLFGFIDVLCLGDGEIIGVQTTSRGNISKRAAKIKEHENLLPVLDSGIRIVIHGWAKNKSNRWEVKESEIKFVPEENAELDETA
mgnify:FL=1